MKTTKINKTEKKLFYSFLDKLEKIERIKKDVIKKYNI